MRITRDDIARRAGVSTAVVSYVLNNGPQPVAPTTRARVLAAVEELGYRPNHVARSLKLRQTHTLGLIVPDAANPFYSEVAKGIEDEAYHRGYNVSIGNTNSYVERRAAYVENLISRQVDGIVFIASGILASELDWLERFGVPAVYIGFEGEMDASLQSRLHYVSVSSEQGGFDVGVHLVERGHHRIACIMGLIQEPPFVEVRWHRVDGFVRALTGAGLAAQIIPAGEHAEEGYQAALRLLQTPERPTAIFATNDLLAAGVIRAAAELAMRVPHDLAVCGFDDIAMARFLIPSLTSVHVPTVEMGQHASRIMFELLDAKRNRVQSQVRVFDTVHLKTELVVREST
jgi:LacI family transcriptional regulator